jgi:hypothetical protein
MSPWKSPILYVGIVLVLAVVAALAAPFVVDWNGYRAGIEDYGRRLTGREVKVQGPIAVRLFPWPRLTLNKVSVANPAGAADPNLVEAEQIVVRTTLGGLLNGSIDVESIDVVKPIFSFERLATGRGTWHIAPAADLGKSKLLDRVKLDRINLIDGAVRLADRRRGGVAVIEHIGGTLSAPAIIGPWRARLNTNYAGSDLTISINTGPWRPSEPFKFSFTLTPPAGGGYGYSFDGSNDGKKISGVLRAEPAPEADGKRDAVPAWRRLSMSAKVTSDFDHIALEDIDIASAGTEEGGTLMSGRAALTLGPTIGVDASLDAPRFDLDAFAGQRAGELLRDGGGLAMLAQLIDALPEAVDGRLAVKVSALKFNGAVLENASFEAALAQGAVRIGRVYSKLPGQSAMLFKGVFLPDPAEPQLAGDLSLESSNLRELVRWAWPQARENIARYWKGSRGRLKLETRVDASPGRLRFSDAEFEFDGSPANGALSLATGEKLAAVLTLNIDEADLDSLISPEAHATGWLQGAFERGVAGIAALKTDLKIGRLRLNGTTAEAVALNASIDDQGLAVSRFEVGAVEGAELDLSGNVRHGAEGLEGALNGTVKASHPRGLLRLLGFLTPGPEPVWVGALGETDLKLDAEFSPKDDLPAATLHAAGRSGDLDLDGTVALSRGLDWRSADIATVAELNTTRGSALARLLGLTPVSDGGEPGRVAVSLTGSLARELLAALDAEAFGATLTLDGKLGWDGTRPTLAGSAKLSAADAIPLAAALGCGICGGGSLEASTTIESGAEGVRLADLKGKKNGGGFAGELAIAPDLAVSGELATGPLALGDLLGAVFTRWDGSAPGIDAPLAARLPLGVGGEIWIRPEALRIIRGLDLAEAQVGVTSAGGETRLAVSGKVGEVEQVSLELGGREDGGVALDGRLSLPLDLGRELKSADRPVASGTMRVDVEFTGSGRSAAAALASLKGTGSYRLKGVRVAAIDAEAFLAAAEKAQSSADLERALASLVAGTGLDVADRSGTLSLAEGAVSFQPVNLRSPRAALTLTPSADLPSGVLSLGLTVNFDGANPPPPLALSYAGEPGQLVRSIDAGRTLSEFGLRILRQGVDELERLQREQDRLAEEEARHQKENADRIASWEAHRREMALRLAEMRVHAEMREQATVVAAADAKRLMADYAEMNRDELGRRVTELRAYRRLRRLQNAALNVAPEAPIFGSETQPQPPRPRRKPRAKARTEVIEVEPGLPIVLVPPDPSFVPQAPKKKPTPSETNRR